MKNLKSIITGISKYIFVFAILFFAVNLTVFAQGEPSEGGSNTVQIISFIINAVMAVIGYFLNDAKEKAKLQLAEVNGKLGGIADIANDKINQVKALADEIIKAVDDDRITPAEIKGIVTAAKAIIKF